MRHRAAWISTAERIGEHREAVEQLAVMCVDGLTKCLAQGAVPRSKAPCVQEEIPHLALTVDPMSKPAKSSPNGPRIERIEPLRGALAEHIENASNVAANHAH